ncbi:unnamed protein product [Cuscuta campestris]|uniref:Thioredoxin-like protein HCF164, chloroplastic n=1 Tax=Cuscuta campestris TaxID=132261 RepID=A0A484MS90_9ASTE|nr:unnamed protein product [Cuscuta campestris]
MAMVVTTPLDLGRLQPLHFNLRTSPPRLQNLRPQFRQSGGRRFRCRIFCQTNPNRNPAECCQTSESAEKEQEELCTEPGSSSNGVASSEVPGSSKDTGGLLEYPDRNFNRRVALISGFGAVALFLSRRLDLGVSLKDLSAAAMPFEQALSNGKPTVVEFYADWCEVCKELARDVYTAEQQYKDKVNFVMLNVDNTKWEQELDEFGVEGIPHFAFLDKDGNEQGNVVGRLPMRYLLENVESLARGETSVPHTNMVGPYSSAGSRVVHQVVSPRSHHS